MSNQYRNGTGGTFLEFFAGGGMARAGLGKNWRCLFANDFDHKKAAAYAENWGDADLHVGDVRELDPEILPDADLAWASFPCQDLSLAGGGAGLKGDRSGTFWPFWNHMKTLQARNRAPKIIVLENVCGTLTSHKGADFTAICKTYSEAGYRFGAVVVDAALFVPQSRPRLFVIGIREDCSVPDEIVAAEPLTPWHSQAVKTAFGRLDPAFQNQWIWWNLPTPLSREATFAAVIEDDPDSIDWHTPDETRRLLEMMTPVNLAKVEDARKAGHRMVGTIYKRTRREKDGSKIQRAEVRFDDVAGCLRTPAGGSSRQLIMVIEGATIKSRLISTRETARLMGLPDSYKLPKRYNDAYHLTGDGVVVPVVRHLARHILEPILEAQTRKVRKVA